MPNTTVPHTRAEFARNLWRWTVGLPPVYWVVDPARQWSHEFERLMRNRLMIGAYRYGPLGAKGKPHYDRVSAAIKRLQRYIESGNTELLVDAANLCLLEFVEGIHPRKHFYAVDDGEHVRTK